MYDEISRVVFFYHIKMKNRNLLDYHHCIYSILGPGGVE